MSNDHGWHADTSFPIPYGLKHRETDLDYEKYFQTYLKDLVDKGMIVTRKSRQGGKPITFKELSVSFPVLPEDYANER